MTEGNPTRDWTLLTNKEIPNAGVAIILTGYCETYVTRFKSADELRGHIAEGGTHYMMMETV